MTMPNDYVLGSWRDVYGTKNKIYFEAQIMKVVYPEVASIAGGSPKKGKNRKNRKQTNATKLL